MTYADKLLADGESVVLRTRQHPLALIKDSRNGLLLWLLAIVLVVATWWLRIGDPWAQLVGIVALACLFIGLLIVVWQYLLWWTEEYMVTNRRLMKVSGVINKRSADSSLEKINDAILTQRFWGRVFNYGDLDILTAADQTVDSYRMLNSAPTFKKTMLNEKHALEMEYSVGRVPSAPLRATTETTTTTSTRAPEPFAPAPTAAESMAPPALPAEPIAPPPASPPPPLPPPADPSLEITQTLARLADLRDRGAITAEEYEAKKAELLGRL
jgi:membrane protein YdbS with pleckstrin-like domain